MKFRALPEGFDAVKRTMIIRSILVVAIVGAVVVVPGLLSEDPTRRQSSIFTGIILVVIFVVTVMAQMKKQKAQYLSIVVAIEDNVVAREMSGMPRVAINTNDVTKILRGPSGNLHVFGLKKKDQILIPSKMENYDEMVALLGSIKPFTESRRNYSFIPLLTLIVMGFILAGAFLVKERIVNIVSMTLLVVVLAVSLVVTQRSPLIESRTKRLSWIVLIPLLSFLFILIAWIKGQ